MVAYLLRGRRRLGRLGRRSRYTKPVYNRGPETRSQRSRFGRSNLILKGNPASDWTHLRGSVCISSTCTPSLRVSGRCLRRRRTPETSLCTRGTSLSSERDSSYSSAHVCLVRKMSVCCDSERGRSRVSVVCHFASNDLRVDKVVLRVVGNAVNVEIQEREREREREREVSVFRISRLESVGKWIQPRDKDVRSLEGTLERTRCLLASLSVPGPHQPSQRRALLLFTTCDRFNFMEVLSFSVQCSGSEN